MPKFSVNIGHQACLRFRPSKETTAAMWREVGLASVYFEVPQFNVAGACTLSLQRDEHGTAGSPRKTIRCITQAIVCTLHSHGVLLLFEDL
ncbi:hypothetical protein Q4I28_006417 [Leishmania naiffi]|uniref:Uncharacterized protein n=1 Tax=Leishmania naiffi TaxID=5678 RepID=A0AAW3BD78_9TRYP